MSSEKIKACLDSTEVEMGKAIKHLEAELAKVRAGKANPAMLDNIQVEYYGALSPINNVASISTPDARTIVIQPWEKSSITPIEKAIMASNLGFNPQNDGVLIRIMVPPLTEERRKDLVKKAKAETENCKVVLRNLRRDANEVLKKLNKEGTPDDLIKTAETKIQNIINSFTEKADKHLEQKEKEIMTV